jgi:hypothetical protein
MISWLDGLKAEKVRKAILLNLLYVGLIISVPIGHPPKKHYNGEASVRICLI